MQTSIHPDAAVMVELADGSLYQLQTLMSFTATISVAQGAVSQATFTFADPRGEVSGLKRKALPKSGVNPNAQLGGSVVYGKNVGLQAMDAIQMQISDGLSTRAQLKPIWTGFVDTVHRVRDPQQGYLVQVQCTSPYKLFEEVRMTAADAVNFAVASSTGVGGIQVLKYAASQVTYPVSRIKTDDKLVSGIYTYATSNITAQFFSAELQTWSAVLQSIQADSGAELFFDETGGCVFRLPQYLTRSPNPQRITPDQMFSIDLATSDQGVATEVEVRYLWNQYGELPGGNTDSVGFWQAPATMAAQLRTRHVVISAPYLQIKAAANNLAKLMGQLYAANVISASVSMVADPRIKVGTVIELEDPDSGGIWEFYVSNITYQLSWGSGWGMVLGLSYGRNKGATFPYDVTAQAPVQPVASDYPNILSPGTGPSKTSPPLTLVANSSVPAGEVWINTQDVGTAQEALLVDKKGLQVQGTLNGYYALVDPSSPESGVSPPVSVPRGTAYITTLPTPTSGPPYTATLVNFSTTTTQTDPTSTTVDPSTTQPTAGSSPSLTGGAGSSVSDPPRPFIFPLAGNFEVVQVFGDTKFEQPHNGVDLSDSGAGRGGYGSPVHAAASGVVRFAGVANGSLIDNELPVYGVGPPGAPPGGFGNCVVTRSGRYGLLYGHLYSIAVAVGDQVPQNGVLGIEGSTGSSYGVHVHFSIWDFQQHGFVDPFYFLPSHALLTAGDISLTKD